MAGDSQLIVVMGVSGCGKSTIASAVAKHLNYTFVEADDFHSIENKRCMESGRPLTDQMRTPWINTIYDYLVTTIQSGERCVLSFSGLRETHRSKIRSAATSVTTLYLNGPIDLIKSRMEKRQHHFMPSSLLESQYQALEDPSFDPGTISVDIDCSIDELIERSLTALRNSTP